MTPVRCRGAHWFSLRGAPGWRSPVCTRGSCTAPNPRWSADDEHQWMESLSFGYIPEYLAEKCRPPLTYAWCETCLGPVTKVETKDREEELLLGDPTRDLTRIAYGPKILIEPCRHGPNPEQHRAVFSVGTIDLLDDCIGPIPSISIRGFDPARLEEV